MLREAELSLAALIDVVVLALSLLALALGPALAWALGRTSRAAGFLDGLVLVALSGVVVLHILPHAVRAAGWGALAVAVVGLALPFLAERPGHPRLAVTHRVLMPLVMASFGVHAFADGAALVEGGARTGGQLVAFAVVLHRLPDGLAIWTVVRPARGDRAAAVVLGALALCTVLGFALGAMALEGRSGEWIALLQAFVAGSVLHVLIHRPHPQAERTGHAHDTHPALSAAGAFLGLMLLLGLTGVHATQSGVLAMEAAAAPIVALLAVGLRRRFG